MENRLILQAPGSQIIGLGMELISKWFLNHVVENPRDSTKTSRNCFIAPSPSFNLTTILLSLSYFGLPYKIAWAGREEVSLL